MEALACRVPAVATAVDGIPNVLSHPGLGILLEERSDVWAADAISGSLARPGERGAIRRFAELRRWETTARAVSEVFQEAMADHSG